MKIKIIEAEQRGEFLYPGACPGVEEPPNYEGRLDVDDLWNGYGWLRRRSEEAESDGILARISYDELPLSALLNPRYAPIIAPVDRLLAADMLYYFTKENCLFENKIIEDAPSGGIHILRFGGPEKTVDAIYKDAVRIAKTGIIWHPMDYHEYVQFDSLYKKTKEEIYEADEGIDLRKFESISRLEEFLKSGGKMKL
jgi:hypothetical protein